MRSRLCLIVLSVLLTIEAASSPRVREQTDDEQAILQVLYIYIAYCAIGRVGLPEPTDNPGWFVRFLDDFGRHFEEQYGRTIDHDVLSRIDQDHEHLTSLFGTEPEVELGVLFVPDTLRMIFPQKQRLGTEDTGYIDGIPRDCKYSSREMRRLRKELGVFRTEVRHDPELASQRAELEFDMVFSPLKDTANDVQVGCQSFRQRRVLTLQKNTEWIIIGDQVPCVNDRRTYNGEDAPHGRQNAEED